MKNLLIISCLFLVAAFASCDLRSGIARQEMEKFSGTPTPSISATPTPEPISPADIITVDTSLEGPSVNVDGYEQKKTVACPKYNRVMVNGDDNTVTVKGACSQIMINGDNNQITAEASMAYILNGTENTVKYSKYANGKRPIVTENKPGNKIEKADAIPVKK
ncbi:MAG: DUF3060 domain-containing protein [Pyrinomonadaceae bacterium]